MRNIELLIAYNGKNYSGWQMQSQDITIQGEIEKALSKICKNKIKITGAGRTDAGVHARGQVANFLTNADSIPAEKFSIALNSLLPNGIRILESSLASDSFNARHDAVKRVYEYNLTNVEALMPWERDFSFYVRDCLNIEKLNDIASVLVGIHDFSAFSAPLEEHLSPIREVFASSFYVKYPFIVYRIAGSGFLRKMVRSIVGTIVSINRKGGSGADMEKVLTSLDRTQTGTTAPARGLFLVTVYYASGLKRKGRKNNDYCFYR